jgi:hypothetical protein
MNESTYERCPTCGFATIYKKGQMSEQPPCSAKATQGKQEEWTIIDGVARFGTLSFGTGKRPELYSAIADAHNAALADEQEKTKLQGKYACELFDECKKLQEQLVTERELPLYCDIHGTELQRESCNHVRTCEQCLAAEREKLVEAAQLVLDSIDAAWGTPSDYSIGKLRDALAEVKEDK